MQLTIAFLSSEKNKLIELQFKLLFTFSFLKEVDNLMLVKTMEYLSSSIKTLTSLTQLIDEVKNMVIADSIKVEIEQAVDSIKQVVT